MSRFIPDALQAHLNSGATHLALCWKITPPLLNPPIGFTEYGQDIIVENTQFQAKGGMTATSVRQSDDLSPDNLDVDFFLDFAGIHETDLRAGLYDFARLDIFFVNAQNPTQGKIDLLQGSLGEITFMRGYAKAQIRSLTDRLQKDITERISPTCRAELGDERCTVNLNDFTVSGVVSSVIDNQQFTDDNRMEANNTFNQGLLTWNSGQNAQSSIAVKQFKSGGQFIFYEPTAQTIEMGDAYSVYRGCNKTLSTCRNVFANVVNFRGEPHLPGIDQIFKFGGQR